jgi:hypothetical protein
VAHLLTETESSPSHFLSFFQKSQSVGRMQQFFLQLFTQLTHHASQIKISPSHNHISLTSLVGNFLVTPTFFLSV